MERCNAICLTGRRCKKYSVNNGLCWTHNFKEIITCAICLDDSYDIDKMNVKLDCGHIFCIKCIYTLVIETNRKNCQCPLCREYLSKKHYVNAIYWGLATNYIYRGYLIINDLSLIDFDEAVFLTNTYQIEHSHYIFDNSFSIIFDKLSKCLKSIEIFNKLKERSVLKRHFVKTKRGEYNPTTFHYFKNVV